MDKEKDLKEQKIETAVKFLKNPRVRQTPMEQRRAFLEKKGLTKDEIDQAIALSGTAADENTVPSTAVVPAQSVASYGPPPPPPPPPTVAWRGYLGAAVIGGSLGYLLVNLFKTYISPLIFDMKEKDDKLDKLEIAVAQTNTTVTEAVGSLQTTLQSVQEILVQQQKLIHSLSSDLAVTQDKLTGLPTDSYSVGDLKAEIVSLKGLLLNRKQFAPAIISSPQAGIPAWQRMTTPSPSSVSFTRDVKGGDGSTQQLTNQQQETGSLKVHSGHMNGQSSNMETSANQERTPQNSSSSSENCSPITITSNLSLNEKSMNDALMVDEGDLSNDTTLSSLSDMSASASFNEASIAFSSTCIKIPSEATSVDDSAMVDMQEVD